MIRIIIDWQLISPVLKVVTGILTIDEVDISKQHYKTLLKCGVKCEPGVIGFSSTDNKDYFIPSKVLEKYDDHIRDLIQAYYDGVMLNGSIFSWIDEDKEMKKYKAV